MGNPSTNPCSSSDNFDGSQKPNAIISIGFKGCVCQVNEEARHRRPNIANVASPTPSPEQGTHLGSVKNVGIVWAVNRLLSTRCLEGDREAGHHYPSRRSCCPPHGRSRKRTPKQEGHGYD